LDFRSDCGVDDVIDAEEEGGVFRVGQGRDGQSVEEVGFRAGARMIV
jgi:hypothetical protein